MAAGRWVTRTTVAVLGLLVVLLTGVAFFSEPAPADRFPPPAGDTPASPIEANLTTEAWTQYVSYGTVRIGDVERPAALLRGHVRFTRTVPAQTSAARYEAYVGALAGSVRVRLACAGLAPIERRVEPGAWTRLALDLSGTGARRRIDVTIDMAPSAVAAWATDGLVAATPGDRPDVLLISLDTVRRDRLSPYGAAATTPALTAFAREATVFDGAVSTSSWTVSSHATLFTGRFLPDSLGYSTRVEPAESTLAEVFAADGYRTFGVSGGPFTDSRWGMHQGFDEYVASGARENARDATSRAIDWMQSRRGAPTFVFLNYFDAHEPLDLSPAVQQLTGVTEGVPASMWFALDSGAQPMTDALRLRLLRAYDAEITAIDRQLGRLFDAVRASGRWDQTLIIVWGDHGQLLGERGFIGHAYTLDEELLRVPLIVKPPAGSRLQTGRYSGLIQGDDLFLLTQALAGILSDQGLEIVDAVSQHQPIRPLAFAKIHHDPLPDLTAQRRWRSATQWAVHDGATKVVVDLERRWTAYDVAGDGQRPMPLTGRASALVAALERFRTATTAGRAGRTVGPLSPAERNRLRSLGYIQ